MDGRQLPAGKEHATETLDMWVSRQPLRMRRGPMAVIFPHGTGLDGPQKTVMACRVAPDPPGRPTGSWSARHVGR